MTTLISLHSLGRASCCDFLPQEEEMEELKAKGLYSEPKVTQYEEQGVGTSKRNRRVSEE
jgi:hypothetical protein